MGAGILCSVALGGLGREAGALAGGKGWTFVPTYLRSSSLAFFKPLFPVIIAHSCTYMSYMVKKRYALSYYFFTPSFASIIPWHGSTYGYIFAEPDAVSGQRSQSP